MTRQITCSICGSTYSFNLYPSQSSLARIMRTKSLCFDCAFWMDYKDNPQVDTQIISGKLYRVLFKKDILYKKQSRKRKGIILARDLRTGDLVYSFDYQYIADVPERFKNIFPDQFRFISESTYYLLYTRANKECLAKGCWDRYHCYWYNKDKAEPNNPWNTIPHYHKVGDEGCESFINKDTMYNVNIEAE